MSDTPIENLVESLLAKCIAIEARCDALETCLSGLSRQCGEEKGKMDKALDELTKHCHQKRLEKLEALDPGLAARLDRRPL